jgi:hypothetical protein
MILLTRSSELCRMIGQRRSGNGTIEVQRGGFRHDGPQIAVGGYGSNPLLPLGSYLLLLDYTSRLCRAGKARVSREVVSILDRLGTSAEVWGLRVQRLLSQDRVLGSCFSTDRQRLRELACKRGVHHLDNLGSCPAA